MLPRIANETVTVLRAAQVTERGTTREDWAAITEKLLTGCIFQPGTSAETGTVHSSTATLFAPFEADVTSADRIRRAGLVYNIEGDPIRLGGTLNHTVLELKRNRG